MSTITVLGTPDALPRWTVDSVPTFVVRGDEPPYLSDVGEVAVLSDRRLIVEDNPSAEVWMFDPTAGIQPSRDHWRRVRESSETSCRSRSGEPTRSSSSTDGTRG